MLILIAGPYRSGTNDNQKLMQQNLNSLESVALLLFRKGHIPMIGEWVALLLTIKNYLCAKIWALANKAQMGNILETERLKLRQFTIMIQNS